jgi:hypothetical protein
MKITPFRGIIGSNGQGNKESVFFPILLFFVYSAISIFSYYVSTLEWAMWFWSLYTGLFGFLAVVCLIFSIIIYLDD